LEIVFIILHHIKNATFGKNKKNFVLKTLYVCFAMKMKRSLNFNMYSSLIERETRKTVSAAEKNLIALYLI
jgi:hypothetical protein